MLTGWLTATRRSGYFEEKERERKWGRKGELPLEEGKILHFDTLWQEVEHCELRHRLAKVLVCLLMLSCKESPTKFLERYDARNKTFLVFKDSPGNTLFRFCNNM